MVLPGTDGLLSKVPFSTLMITALQHLLIRIMFLPPGADLDTFPIDNSRFWIFSTDLAR